MKNNSQKPLSVFLSLVMLASLTGCNSNETGAYVGESSSLTETSIEIQSEEPVIFTEQADFTFESYLDSLLIKYPNLDVKDILEHPEEYLEEVQVAASYANLKAHGLSLSDIKENLHRILTLGQVPRCSSNEEFVFATGKLLEIVPDRANPFSCYFALAKAVHLAECQLIHDVNEFGIFSCDNLMEEYNANYKEISIEEFLDEYLLDNDLYLGLKEYILKTNLRMDDIVWELENVVTFGLLPGRGMDEAEFNFFFGNLLANTLPTESLFDKFVPLAKEVHNLLYPDDRIELSKEETMLIRVKKEG